MNRNLLASGAASLLVFCASCDLPRPGPVEPVPVAPAAGAVLNHSVVEFEWQPVPGAAEYEFQLGRGQEFEDPLVSDTVAGVSLSLRVCTDGRHGWRVRARNGAGLAGEWAESDFVLERFRVIATKPASGYAQDICVRGTRAYVADGQAGLAVFDVSRPEAPELLGLVSDSLNIAYGVAADDRYCYVAYGYKELLVADLLDPDSMTIVGELEYPQPGTGYDVAVNESLAFVAADAQFLVVGIVDPAHPELRYQDYYPRCCRGVALDAGRCYLALEQLGIVAWDVASMPPVQLGSVDTRSNARGLAAMGGIVYVADGRAGLTIVDARSPEAPLVIGSLELNGYADDVSVQDSLAFVAITDGEIAVVDIGDPTQPGLVARIAANNVRGVQRLGNYLYAADRDLGLVVVEILE